MPRRRLMLFLALCLLAGASFTVLSAWTFAVTRPWYRFVGDLTSDFAATWPRMVPRDWPQPNLMIEQHAFGWTITETMSSTLNSHTAYTLEVWSFGFPFRAMDWMRQSSPLANGYSPSTAPPWSSFTAGVECPGAPNEPSIGSPARLPLRPIPLGFAANTLLYAAAIAGLITLTRHLRRPRPGRCPRCRYDLTGTPTNVCPECGRAQSEPRP